MGRKKTSKSIDDSFNEDDEFDLDDPSSKQKDEVVEDDDDIDVEEEEEEEEDDTSKKRKRVTRSTIKKPAAAVKADPATTQLPYQDRIFIVYNHENNLNKDINNNNNNNQNNQNNNDKDENKDKDNNLTIVSILNPKSKCTNQSFTNVMRYSLISDNETRYIVDRKNQIVMEINNYKESPSSWFMNNGVRHDGSLYMSCPIDPLFLIIGYLERSRSQSGGNASDSGGNVSKVQFVEKSQLESDQPGKELKAAGYTFTHEQLELICDHTTLYSSDLYRLSDDRLLLWLKCKARSLATYLETSNTNIYRASSLTTNKAGTTKLQWLQMALEFLSEYLNEKWMLKLRESLISNKTSAASNSTTADDSNLIYNARMEQFALPDSIANNNNNSSAATKKKSATKAKLAVAPKQNSKISDFFK
ncbi:hypothetical protein PPL_09098 [Heterostelium album PN500]|uniref:Ribonuclease H2 subunit B wHTH domain-containing protein n=1 Tax=Heterostelium pallidum (strain ATCC 26659 / Pp 5 / PN500) TaxID=670386 RepID=D3BKL6_HETP5|nr:hypothetical protein PPL_09098 [Heterostelium album PN500]EFA78446.1 hypothetical protein PPL_09098 [Heterostelium album PN500]|eukprot:XP_020430571.1 hypothetical protein PPL_09098 [Heterostelium album PN500]